VASGAQRGKSTKVKHGGRAVEGELPKWEGTKGENTKEPVLRGREGIADKKTKKKEAGRRLGGGGKKGKKKKKVETQPLRQMLSVKREQACVPLQRVRRMGGGGGG